MKLTENKTYFSYVILGLIYFISKVIFFFCGFVYMCGVLLGLIATILTTYAGICAFKECEGASKNTAHWLAVLFPLIILPLTPVIMIYNLGQGVFHLEKIIVLVIFEGVAIAQVILAVSMFKGLVFKRIKKRQK
jgi:hypothetical protein